MRRRNALVAVAMIAATTEAITQAQPGPDQGSAASGDAVLGSDAAIGSDAVLGSGAENGSGSAERPSAYVAKSTNTYADRSSLSAVAFAVSPGEVLYPTAQRGPWTLVENEDGKTGWIATSKLVADPPPRDAERANRPTDAPSPTTPTSTPPLAMPSRARCDTGLYLEPSLFLTAGSWSSRPRDPAYSTSSVGQPFHRVSAGVLFRRCENGLAAAHVRIGATGYLGKLVVVDGQDLAAGIGLEGEIDFPIRENIRLGGRLGAETARRGNPAFGATLFTFGARLSITDGLWVGLDLFHMTEPSVSGAPSCDAYFVRGCTASTTGMMLGIGVRGRAGAYIGGAEAAIAGLVLLALLGSAGHE